MEYKKYENRIVSESNRGPINLEHISLPIELSWCMKKSYVYILHKEITICYGLFIIGLFSNYPIKLYVRIDKIISPIQMHNNYTVWVFSFGHCII